MRWRLILEEYGSELVNTLGNTYIVADALSHLEIAAFQPTLGHSVTFSILQLTNAELLGHDSIDTLAVVYPLSYKLLASLQGKDAPLQQALLRPNTFSEFVKILGKGPPVLHLRRKTRTI
jgi:hypothetical protein